MQFHPQLASALLTGLFTVASVNAQSVDSTAKHPADNTAANVTDRSTSSTTPMDQSNDKEAIAVTAAIRRAVMSDKSLSTSAHNVKIVTNGNAVTIRGAVATAEEKKRIESLAAKSAPGKQVRNEISVSD
jgi:hyperosmotically inducible protein